MGQAGEVPAAVARSVRLYRALLRTYPMEFRRAYGQPLAQAFHDLALSAHARAGWRGVLALWPAALGDLARNAAGERLASVRRWHGHADEEEARMIRGILGNEPIAVRHGALFGGGVGLVWAVYNGVNSLLNLDARGNDLLNNGLLIALVALYALAGLTVGLRTGRAGAGGLAGLYAGALGTALGLLTLWLATLLLLDTIGQHTFILADFARSGGTDLRRFVIEDAVGASLFGGVANLALGAALGTVGGLLGGWRGRRAGRS